jgi:two-component system, response regulator PdtaR
VTVAPQAMAHNRARFRPPSAAARSDERRTTMSEAAAPTKGKILVVDDDRLVLATLTHGLTQAGYTVIDADNGDDAILLAREHKPELALLDIRMEGKSGFDVADYLRQPAVRVPFMFLSAFSDDATIAQVNALGAVAYLVKPLDIRQIVPAVEAAFANIHRQVAGSGTAHGGHERGVVAPDAPELAMPVAMAVGVLMHRYSLARGPALERLRRQAQAENRPLADQAERLLQAVELLSNPGD